MPPALAPLEPSRLQAIESELRELSVESSQASWIAATYLTGDSEALAARCYARLLTAGGTYAAELAAADRSRLAPADERKVALLRLFAPLVAPRDARDAQRLTQCLTEMEAI